MTATEDEKTSAVIRMVSAMHVAIGNAYAHILQEPTYESALVWVRAMRKLEDVQSANVHDREIRFEVNLPTGGTMRIAVPVPFIQADYQEFAGYCEGCNEPLFNNESSHDPFVTRYDNYRTDGDGVKVCLTCWKELCEEAEKAAEAKE